MNLLQSWQQANPQLFPAVGLAVAFAFLAWGLSAVTAAAALTGIVLTVILCLAAGPAALIPVIIVFLLTVVTTRIGRRKKERLGTAEPRRGRGAPQSLANVSGAAICAAPLIFVPYARYILLAGAAAGTLLAPSISLSLAQSPGEPKTRKCFLAGVSTARPSPRVPRRSRVQAPFPA